jgi:hypothetical protein
MSASTALKSGFDVQSFINEYFGVWQGTDEDRIMSYYVENVVIQIPGQRMEGQTAVREQFVRPFITGFPGNRHIAKNMILGQAVVVVEWSFEAEHKGLFAGRPATDAWRGCSWRIRPPKSLTSAMPSPRATLYRHLERPPANS